MDFFKQHILRLEKGGGKNLPWRRSFNFALMGGGLKELAEKTPGLFLRVLGFVGNGEIIWSLVNLAKDVRWNVLLRNKFPHDFKTDEDIVTKFKWLRDLKGINALIPKGDQNLKSKKRKRDEEETYRWKELQSKALKCFFYWTKGWSKVLRGHTDWVGSVIKLNETTVVSASYDCTLRLWDLTNDLTNDTSRVLQGHTGLRYAVTKLNETTIVSGSFIDGTLRVWDLTNDTSRVLRGHTNWVQTVIKLNENMIVSGSGDRTLRVWDLQI